MRPDGRLLLLAQPRVLGHVFNPVSFWLIHDADRTVLRVVIAEVSNTFGDRHSYLVHNDDLSPIRRDQTLQARKIFHVSPFQPVEGGYSFRFDIRDDKIGIFIDYHTGNGGLLATLTGPRRPLTNGAILRACRAPPLRLAARARALSIGRRSSSGGKARTSERPTRTARGGGHQVTQTSPQVRLPEERRALPGYAVFAAMLASAGLPIYIHAPKFFVDHLWRGSCGAGHGPVRCCGMIDFRARPGSGLGVRRGIGAWRSTAVALTAGWRWRWR
jgi:hypothetical protein